MDNVRLPAARWRERRLWTGVEGIERDLPRSPLNPSPQRSISQHGGDLWLCLCPDAPFAHARRAAHAIALVPPAAPRLRKIPVADLRLGMHLHALEGSWIDHPFWRSRFTLVNPADLQRLCDSDVKECWVDDRLSQPEAAEAPPPALPPAPLPAPPPALRSGPPPASPPPSPESVAISLAAAATPLAPSRAFASQAAPPTHAYAAELQQAAAICQRGRGVVLSMFSEARMGRALDIEGCLPLVEEITRSVMRHPGALVTLARLKTQDDYSYMHSMAVCALMVALAREMGMDEAASRAAGVAGLMHDVGKAVMPLAVLNKPGRLTEAEYDTMRSHPERGHALLLESRGATPQTLDVTLHHHEKMDGSGYPHRLAGEGISLLARMGAVCDVYDAITSNRPYKRGWDPADSVSRMAGWDGHFDPEVFATFVRSLGIYPPGSLVKLTSERLAVVMEPSPQQLLRPVVRVFWSLRLKRRLVPQRLDLSAPGCSDRIVGRAKASDHEFGATEDLWMQPELLKRSRAG